MLDQFLQYRSIGEKTVGGQSNNKLFLPDFYIQILESYGYLSLMFKFTDIVLSGISELALSFASNVPEFQTFSATFKYKIVEIIDDKKIRPGLI